MSSKTPYRKIPISKLDWTNDEIEPPILLKEIETELRESLNNISEGKKTKSIEKLSKAFKKSKIHI